MTGLLGETTALIVVDVQNDFISGSLAVNGGEEVAKRIAEFLARASHPQSTYPDFVVATQDWHIDPEGHFSDTPDYVDTWPRHCVAGTEGARIHEAFLLSDFDELFEKGRFTAAYSGFEGTAITDQRPLAKWLRDRNVTDVDICGIATDYCVKATALDAVKHGFHTTVITDLCAAVGDPEAAYQEMSEAGVVVGA